MAERGASLDGAQTQDLQAWQAQRAAQGAKATSSNRGLSVLRRYYHWALQEQRLQHDPSVLLLAAKRLPRVPHVLSEPATSCWLQTTGNRPSFFQKYTLAKYWCLAHQELRNMEESKKRRWCRLTYSPERLIDEGSGVDLLFIDEAAGIRSRPLECAAGSLSADYFRDHIARL